MKITLRKAALLLASTLIGAAISINGVATASTTVETEQVPNSNDEQRSTRAATPVPHSDVHVGCYENKLTMAESTEQQRERINLVCRLINGFLMPPFEPTEERVTGYLTENYVSTVNGSLVEHFGANLIPAVYEINDMGNFKEKNDTVRFDLNVGGQLEVKFAENNGNLLIDRLRYV